MNDSKLRQRNISLDKNNNNNNTSSNSNINDLARKLSALDKNASSSNYDIDDIMDDDASLIHLLNDEEIDLDDCIRDDFSNYEDNNTNNNREMISSSSSNFFSQSAKTTEKITYEDKQQQTNESPNSSTLSNENLCWLLASILCIYLSNIVNVVLSDERVYRSLLLIAFFFMASMVGLMAYMIIGLTYVRKIDPKYWNETNPVLIPLVTACFITASLLLIVSLWPVYTWITIPLLFTILMGLVVILINIPASFKF